MIADIICWVTLLLPLVVAVVAAARVAFRCREWPWVLGLTPLSGCIAGGITAAVALKVGSYLVFLIEGSGQGPNMVGVSGDNLFTFLLFAGVQTAIGTLLALIVAIVVLSVRGAKSAGSAEGG